MMPTATIAAFIDQMIPDRLLVQAVSGVRGEVSGLIVDAGGCLHLQCQMEKPCPADLLCRMEDALERHLPTSEVIISQTWPAGLPDPACSQYAASLAPWLLRHLRKKDVLTASVLLQATFQAEDDHVSVHLHDACRSVFEISWLKSMSDWLGRYVPVLTSFRLAAECGEDLAVYTRRLNDERDSLSSAAARDMSDPGPMPPAAPVADDIGNDPRSAATVHLPVNAGISGGSGQYGTEASGKTAKKTIGTRAKATDRAGKGWQRQPAPPGMIWGRINPKLRKVPIDSLNSETGLALIEGEVFDLDIRAVSDGTRVLFKFALTDLSSSISCILFAKPEDRAMLEEKLTKAYIRAGTEISFDSQYAKDLQAKITGIQDAVRKPLRSDHAPAKRIELHAHTKMSTKDAVCDAGDLVRLAASFGHPAVAITDHGIVQAFPDAAVAREDLRKKKKNIKIIYGMEGYLVDDGNPVAWMVEHTSLDDGFIALDVETTGLDPAADRLI